MSQLFSPTALVVPFEQLRMSDVESVGGQGQLRIIGGEWRSRR